MQNRINAIKANGTDAEIEIFDGLPHGFGLGTGTVAEGGLTMLLRSGKEKYNYHLYLYKQLAFYNTGIILYN